MKHYLLGISIPLRFHSSLFIVLEKSYSLSNWHPPPPLIPRPPPLTGTTTETGDGLFAWHRGRPVSPVCVRE